MYARLTERASTGSAIKVALVGAGRMGVGIARQLGALPGLALVGIADIDPAAAEAAARAYRASGKSGDVVIASDALSMLAQASSKIDVVVEATPTIGFAAEVVERAFEIGADVVLMNAEVDLALG